MTRVARILLATAPLATACEQGEPGVQAHADTQAAADETAELRARILAAFAPSAEVQSAIDAIDEALETLPDHPWAGVYYYGDGLGRNVKLRISPRAFTFTRSSCGGLSGENHGSVTLTDGILRLRPEMDLDTRTLDPVPTELVPIRWGPRRYLIPPDQIQAFRLDAAGDYEPRETRLGNYFLRSGDEAFAVTGSPTVPSAYIHDLAPIEAEIVRILKVDEFEEKYTFAARLDTTAEIDAGSSSGVFLHMELKTVDPDLDWITASVTEVGPETAEVLFKQYPSSKNPYPEVGWRLERQPRTRRR